MIRYNRGERMWKYLRKFFIVVLLLTSLFQLSAEPSFHVDWDKLDNNLNTIELNLNQLQIDNQNLQTQLINAGNQLSEQIKYSANQQIQYKILEDNYEKLEKTTRIWKVCFLTATTVCVVETVILIIGRTK